MTSQDNRGKEGYQDLIDEGIDTLNTSQNFSHTDLKEEERKSKHKSEYFASIPFLGFALLAVVSVIITFIYQVTGPEDVLTQEKADAQLEQAFEKSKPPESVPVEPVGQYLLEQAVSGQDSDDEIDAKLKELQGESDS